MFQPVKPPRLADMVAGQIKQLILEGSLAPGDRLPAERDLAERFGVSRPTVRDAIASLEQRGLLIPQRGGMQIAAVTAAAITDPLSALLFAAPETAFDYLEFRLVIEASAAQFAAMRATDIDRQALRACFEEMEALHEQGDQGKGDPEAEATIDAAFHLMLYEMAHNVVILHVMRGLSKLLRNDVLHNRANLNPRHGYRAVTLKQHRAIYQAVMAGEPDAARAAALAHVSFARDALSEIRRADARLAVSLRRLAGKAALDIDPKPDPQPDR